MKKRIIISSSIIIFAALFAILLVVFIPNKKEELKISSFDEIANLDLGTYNVKSFKRGKIEGGIDSIEFYVKSAFDFYNDVIKTCSIYNTRFEFEKEDFYAFGYLFDDIHIYHYEIRNDKFVKINAFFGSIESVDGYNYQDAIIPGPFYLYMDKKEIENIGCYYLRDKITLNELVALLEKLNKDIFMVKDDFVYIKGYLKDNKNTLPNDYILKVYCENNILKVLVA